MNERAAEPDVPSVMRLGPFNVSTPRAEVEAFCRETGWPDSFLQDHFHVPHTFPMRWLTAPELHAAIEAALATAGGIAIHESQSFTYEERLDVDRDYLLNADIETTKNPDRLILRVSVAEPLKDIVLWIETILRLIVAVDPVR